MLNFSFKRATEYVFGKGVETKAGEMLKKYGATKVLVHYGQGSVVRSGLLARVEDSINAVGIPYVSLGGVQPNPVDKLVYEGIELCRKESVDFVIAVGGGSVIDSAKAIAAGVLFGGDFWDFYSGKAEMTKALPIATVLTIPAAGSEGSPSTVINKITGDGPIEKRGSGGDCVVPTFSLLNPELSYTLPSYQTACGAVDIMAHVMERYFTNTPDVEITDRLCEAVLLTVIKHAPTAIAQPENYAARSNIYWAGTVAHDDSIGLGREGDWATHLMEHELSALYGVAHGAGLAVMFPAWMEYVCEQDLDRFVRFAKNVWNIDCEGDKKATAMKAILTMKDFFKSLDMPTSFAELGAKKEDIDKLVEILFKGSGGKPIGGFVKLAEEDARKVYEIAAR